MRVAVLTGGPNVRLQLLLRNTTYLLGVSMGGGGVPTRGRWLHRAMRAEKNLREKTRSWPWLQMLSGTLLCGLSGFSFPFPFSLLVNPQAGVRSDPSEAAEHSDVLVHNILSAVLFINCTRQLGTRRASNMCSRRSSAIWPSKSASKNGCQAWVLALV